MSEWTHIAATFRFDFAPVDDKDDFTTFMNRVIGKRIPDPPDAWLHDDEAYEDWQRISRPLFDERAQYPERFVPYGSEGGLTVVAHPVHDRSLASNLVVSCFGDLRDFGDNGSTCGNMHTLRRWFRRVITEAIDPGDGHGSVHVRQAVLTATDEGVGTLTMTFDGTRGGRFLNADDEWVATFPDEAFPEYPDTVYEAFRKKTSMELGRILPVPIDVDEIAKRRKRLDDVLASI